ncbi:MAG: ABC transporter substrate-binding protein [Candidatus Rokubacteria bacterium]|nr:ABC transporter substrate-binding protein [Candidatus Rokubacteria bacterium]
MVTSILLQAAFTIAVAGPATSPEYLPHHVAGAGGFTRAGAQVVLRPTRSAADAAEALARGTVDLAATSVDAALRLGHVNGRPPRLVMGLTSVPPVALLVSTAHGEGVRALADLADKPIGIPAPGSPEQAALAWLLARARPAPAQITILSHGERGLAASIAKGEVVAGMIGDPWATRLLAMGQARALVDLRRPEEAARWLGGPTVHAGLFVRGEQPPSDAELEPVLRAVLWALARVQSEPPAEIAAGLPVSVVGLPEDFAARVLGARRIYLPAGVVTAEALEASIDLARARATLPAAVNVPRDAGKLLLTRPLQKLIDGR